MVNSYETSTQIPLVYKSETMISQPSSLLTLMMCLVIAVNGFKQSQTVELTIVPSVDDGLEIRFEAFGRLFTPTIVPNLHLLSSVGDAGLPYMIKGPNEDRMDAIDFEKHGIRFYHGKNVDGSFVVRNTSDFSLSLDGIFRDQELYVMVNTTERENEKLYAVTIEYPNEDDTSLDSRPILHPEVRRSNGTFKGKVEVLFWTDYSFYTSFKTNMPTVKNIEHEILKYIAVVLNAADRRYKTGIPDESLHLSLSLSGVVICTVKNCSRFVDDKSRNKTIEDTVSLDSFTEHLKQQYTDLKLRFEYDHAMLITRLILVHNNIPINGISNVDKICSVKDGKSSSVVRDRGAYSCVGTAVHELAHCLGSDHDGYLRSKACSSAQEYIMAVMSPLALNGFYFSQCSVNSMKENLMKPSSACITENVSTAVKNFSGLTKTLPGQIYNRTQQCHSLLGTSFCLSVGTKLEDICYKMYCWDPHTPNTCTALTPAALGTSCGNGKWCIEGKCVQDHRAPIIG